MAGFFEVSKEQLQAAMVEFDKKFRDLPEWTDWTEWTELTEWETNAGPAFAIVQEGRYYPPKKIVSLVTLASEWPEFPLSKFLARNQLNLFVKRRGFEVILLERKRQVNKASIDSLAHIEPDIEAPAIALEKALIERTDIGATQKQQLINARRGQGIFRANVRLYEKSCRLTQVSNPEHLRASHIKPWKDSSDIEKIDGSNGLFLAPHIDHLFDRGFISFDDSGQLLISPLLTAHIANSWGIVDGKNVGSFTDKQKNYLAYHRKNVFKATTND